jgi:hypothetical protein
MEYTSVYLPIGVIVLLIVACKFVANAASLPQQKDLNVFLLTEVLKSLDFPLQSLDFACGYQTEGRWIT